MHTTDGREIDIHVHVPLQPVYPIYGYLEGRGGKYTKQRVKSTNAALSKVPKWLKKWR